MKTTLQSKVQRKVRAFQALVCACILFVVQSAYAQTPATNIFVSAFDALYWDGEQMTTKSLPLSSWPGSPWYAAISGDLDAEAAWFWSYSEIDFSTNAGPYSVNSEAEASPSIEIKASVVASVSQYSDANNGIGDLPRGVFIRFSDIDYGEIMAGKIEYRGGSVGVGFSHTTLTNTWTSINDTFDVGAETNFQPYNGRGTVTNTDTFSFPDRFNSELCQNFRFIDYSYASNSWDADFNVRSADTVYRIHSGYLTNSATNTVIIHVAATDLSGRDDAYPLDELAGVDLSGFPSLSSSRISVLINGNTYPLDVNGDCEIQLPNDTKTEFKILVEPDEDGVVWAVFDVSASFPE